MIGPGTGVRVYVASGVTDMRKGIKGLAAAAEQVLRQNPCSAIAELRPIAELISRSIRTATHLHCDDTIIPVLAPTTGQVKKGRMWVVIRDGRPYRGSDPPVVAYFYSPDRKGEHPRAFMKGFTGVLQADGFTGFNAMYKPDPLTQEVQVKEAGC